MFISMQMCGAMQTARGKHIKSIAAATQSPARAHYRSERRATTGMANLTLFSAVSTFQLNK